MQRNFGLDIMRSVSILLVLLQHIGFYIPGLAPLRLGGVGVEVFFVLSGFLIGGILFKEIHKGNNLFQTLKSFWIRRWFRILPLYYAVLLFKFIVLDNSIGWNIFYYVFFLQNNFYGVQFLDVSWSLVIEEWFYLFSPFYIFFSVRILKSQAKIIASLICFILAVLVLRTLYVEISNVPYVGVNGNFPFRFDSLFLGVLLSFLNFHKHKAFAKLNSGGVFVLGLLLFIGYLFAFIKFSNYVDEIKIFRTLGFLLLPLTISLMVPYISSLTINSDKNILNKYTVLVFTKTSILTYAMYLSHPFVNAYLDGTKVAESLLLKSICSLTLTFLMAWLIYTYFERPILNLRDKIQN